MAFICLTATCSNFATVAYYKNSSTTSRRTLTGCFLYFRLTAFVVKTFCAIQKLDGVDIDQNVINTAITWLASRQRADGAIPESTPVVHQEMDVSLVLECSGIVWYGVG